MHHAYHSPLLLSLLLNFSSNRYWEWVHAFGSATEVLYAPANQLKQLTSQARKQLEYYQEQGENSQLAQQAKRVINKVNRCGAQIINYEDPCYPLLLKQIHRPPPLLFIKGNADALSMPQIAIVGSRHASQMGLQNSHNFSAVLGEHGFIITSGLAIGIDGAAHQGALAVKGKSVAVMATGIDRIYPRQHQALADNIVDSGGALVTEFSPGTTVRPRHFPQRNRIISGLCAGVLIVEAAVKSGSLITARYAIEQDREVFAIPGSIHSPQSKGTHALIKEGAHLVENVSDIVEQLNGFLYTRAEHTHTQPLSSQLLLEPSAVKLEPSVGNNENTATSVEQRASCSTQEALLLKHIDSTPVDVDKLAAHTELSAAEISALLISLELKEYISVSDQGYTKKIQ